MEMYEKCKIKTQAIFGTYYGLVKEDDRKAWFFVEELGKLVKIKITSLEAVGYE